MNDRMIISLPISPYDKMSVGRMTTPILGESISKSMNCKFIMAINVLNSYKNKNYSGFINLMNNYNINPNQYWIDNQHVKEMMNQIYILNEMGYICEKEKKIVRCTCGKVEISKDNISTINLKDSLFGIKNDEYYCKFCKSKCVIGNEKVLVFDSKLVDKTNMKFYPDFINKDKTTFDKTVGNNDVVISRNRSTGIIINYKGHKYNLDIDFLWQNYLSLFKEKERIVMCGNHQLYQLYMVGMLEQCFNNNNNTIYLATPYLEQSKDEYALNNRAMSLKVFSLLVLKWAKKENTFDKSLLNYINSMNIDKKQMLYDIIIENIDTTEKIIDDLKYVLTKKYNFQNANKELKRRRRNV